MITLFEAFFLSFETQSKNEKSNVLKKWLAIFTNKLEESNKLLCEIRINGDEFLMIYKVLKLVDLHIYDAVS